MKWHELAGINGMKEINGMEWNRTKRNGTEWNGMERKRNGMERNGTERNRMERNGTEWKGMGKEWDGMGWNGMEWNGMDGMNEQNEGMQDRRKEGKKERRKEGKNGKNGMNGINGVNGVNGMNGMNGTNGMNGLESWNQGSKESRNEYIWPTSSSKSAPIPTVFFAFLYKIELSLQSRAHFADLIFQKCSERLSFERFLCKSSSHYSPVRFVPTSSSKNVLKCKSSSCHSPVHDLSATVPDPGPQPQKQRPYFGDHGSHSTQKNTRSRAECFYPWINSHASELSVFPTTWWWCGWHDETWTWWQDSPWTFVRKSEVCKLNILWRPIWVNITTTVLNLPSFREGILLIRPLVPAPRPLFPRLESLPQLRPVVEGHLRQAAVQQQQAAP